jgi:hypothetical protein
VEKEEEEEDKEEWEEELRKKEELKEQIAVKVSTKFQINSSTNGWENHIQSDMGTDGWTDGWTDGRTDEVSYRGASSHLKTWAIIMMSNLPYSELLVLGFTSVAEIPGVPTNGGFRRSQRGQLHVCRHHMVAGDFVNLLATKQHAHAMRGRVL